MQMQQVCIPHSLRVWLIAMRGLPAQESCPALAKAGSRPNHCHDLASLHTATFNPEALPVCQPSLQASRNFLHVYFRVCRSQWRKTQVYISVLIPCADPVFGCLQPCCCCQAPSIWTCCYPAPVAACSAAPHRCSPCLYASSKACTSNSSSRSSSTLWLCRAWAAAAVLHSAAACVLRMCGSSAHTTCGRTLTTSF